MKQKITMLGGVEQPVYVVNWAPGATVYVPNESRGLTLIELAKRRGNSYWNAFAEVLIRNSEMYKALHD